MKSVDFIEVSANTCPSGRWGRRFKSCHSDQKIQRVNSNRDLAWCCARCPECLFALPDPCSRRGVEEEESAGREGDADWFADASGKVLGSLHGDGIRAASHRYKAMVADKFVGKYLALEHA